MTALKHFVLSLRQAYLEHKVKSIGRDIETIKRNMENDRMALNHLQYAQMLTSLELRLLSSAETHTLRGFS